MGKPKRPNADGDFLTDDDHLDAEVLTAPLPWAIKGIVKDVIELVNTFDVNRDGKDDIVQLAPLARRSLPILLKLLPLVKFDGLLNKYVDDPEVVPVENKAQVKACIKDMQVIADEAAKLQPPQK